MMNMDLTTNLQMKPTILISLCPDIPSLFMCTDVGMKERERRKFELRSEKDISILIFPFIFVDFQLLDTSLKSSHVPAYIAAAFTKKLSRLTLSAPPSGSLVIIAIIHNLLRRHPSINFLVHQVEERNTKMSIPSLFTNHVNCYPNVL